jgi:hypothetical protein
MRNVTKTVTTSINPTKHDWANAMTERLKDQLNDFDDETKQLIGRVFFAGLIVNEDVLESLKSSSLIESDYFDNFTRDATYSIRIRK